VVPPVHRGSGFGSLLAKSYVHYAPLLGYRASVFNLVYVNNIASIKYELFLGGMQRTLTFFLICHRLWERLGFSKAGRIPRAGRLRTKDGLGEEYVDAWVFYKSFQDD
jgi:GNAT superfamily N-acetyltransferase